MPSGKFHDAITIVLAAPAFAAAYSVTNSLARSTMFAISFVFGGVMFGPDLDTVSRQYSRWTIFRFIWFPYRSFFKHRSRFSHGLIFGAFGRVVYFMGVLTLLTFMIAYAYLTYTGGRLPHLVEFTRVWDTVGEFTHSYFGAHFLIVVFAGLWFGAASHTFTDMAGTFIKTGRKEKLF